MHKPASNRASTGASEPPQCNDESQQSSGVTARRKSAGGTPPANVNQPVPSRRTDSATTSALAQSRVVGAVRTGTPAPAAAAVLLSESTAAAPATCGVQRQRLRRETRAQLLERLTNPLLSLHEASVILRVCPATVRRYSNAGILSHVRTHGRQRRYYLRDVLALSREEDARRRKAFP